MLHYFNGFTTKETGSCLLVVLERKYVNKYIKLFAGNAAFAVAMVCLFSPGLIGLSPFSGNTVVAAASVAIGVIAVPSFVLMNKALLMEKKAELLQVNEENADKKARELLEHYRFSAILGGISTSAISQIERMENEVSTFEKLVNRRFGRGTLSYEKFMGVIRSASDALSKSIIRIVNKMIIFDETEYKKLSSAQYKLDDIPDDIQEKKKQLYDENLDDMRSILEKNEKVLLEVDHLMMEMSDMDYSEQDIEGAAAEINKLLNQLEYYNRTGDR